MHEHALWVCVGGWVGVGLIPGPPMLAGALVHPCRGGVRQRAEAWV